MKKIVVLAACLVGCSNPTVVKDRVQTVKVPVSTPCVLGQRPPEIIPLQDQYTRDQWNALTTDQREKLIVAQGLRRKAYSDELNVATSACP